MNYLLGTVGIMTVVGMFAWWVYVVTRCFWFGFFEKLICP